ncbi:MAG TPA: SAM-dependent DNA methyltransferase, partial [Candidatus Faecousia gallistercoris]|nr:SAM-dependent DNA methyltransferase [Candidatus Faecousia gallistercoris]
MNDTQQKVAAKQFAAYWKNKGYEKGESQAFWLSLLRDVYGVEHPEQFITFEEQVHLDHTSFIDGTIPATKVLIEQKGLGKDLKKPIRQSDGTLLTPFQQAKRYITELPLSQHPRWVITCNFSEFYVYDMERPGGEPEIILLENLEKEYYRLQFLVDTGSEHLKREMEVSIAAGEIVGLLYDAFAKQYADPESEYAMKSLNILCVRLVFCLYAEDAGIFGRHGMFHDYLSEFDARGMRRAVVDLFRILDTPPEKRDPYLKDDNPTLAAFPYVNGGLFANEDIEIPPFTDEIRELLLKKASENFNWSEISPTIFGAVFESTLNPETRRKGGMHYTSIENIHKVIDPLFLDDLKAELAQIKEITVARTQEGRLREFQNKLASLTFLDPAAGSGNFLTETYLSLRRLENEILSILSKGQISFGDANYSPIQVSISQFYGIEINDFAVTVARTALWIAESQMMKETESIVLMHLEFLPLKTNANIVEGNALRMDWESVVPEHKLSYIMGNPPF